MAGMFYSLREAAERLGVTEEQVRQLAKDGRLREFRDGSNLLFKMDEVNALVAENIDVDSDALDVMEPTAEEQGPEELAFEAEPELEPGLEPLAGSSEEELEDIFAGEPTPDLQAAADEETFELTEEETPTLEPAAEADASSELGLSPEPEDEQGAGESDFFLLEEEQQRPTSEVIETDEISLAPETGSSLGAESDITDMDTALTGEGVSVLGEGDSEYDVTDDSMAETATPAGTGTEASLEEIEDDVNLDSFGSGSGLLDLSLQADDTSLGGILDEIYTAEGGEEAAAGEPGSVEDITAEVDHVAVGDEELPAPQGVVVAPIVAPAYGAYVEVEPDTASAMLGYLLFLPLLALLYTAIVAVAAQREVMPSILESVQGLIWYIVGGAALVALGVGIASFVSSGEKAPRAAKPKKEKKAKAEKPKKEGKAKAEKPAKEKKSRFGKKKGK